VNRGIGKSSLMAIMDNKFYRRFLSSKDDNNGQKVHLLAVKRLTYKNPTQIWGICRLSLESEIYISI
jgi:hypothetical protein